MSSYGDENLFGTGPHTFDVGPASLRHSLDEASGWDGAAVQSGGQQARRITQRGTLLGDTVEAIEAQRDAIQAVMDGQPRELIDDLGRRWDAVVLVDFQPEALAPVGTRWRLDYAAEYVQVRA